MSPASPKTHPTVERAYECRKTEWPEHAYDRADHVDAAAAPVASTRHGKGHDADGPHAQRFQEKLAGLPRFALE